jgi:hypothetical protein
MSTIFDIKTGNHTYHEGQVYQVGDDPTWYLMRDGNEIPIRWNWWLDHPLHSEVVKKLLTQALAWGWLDLANPESETKLGQIMTWVQSQV